ncbi:hypothetical protein D9M70_637000 [compost metagenome]
MAVNGWFNSWAMPAAISPRVLSRVIAARRTSSCRRLASARDRCQEAAPAASRQLAAAQPSHAAQGQSAGVNRRQLCRGKAWLTAPRGLRSSMFQPIGPPPG